MWYHDLNGNALDFCYNAQGYPYALRYNGTVYYYITNLQGDVVHLVDDSGAVVASYEYDPYGNIVSSTGAMAEINPLRYRGYYYDSDTGFYYLQSRYYDPKTPNEGRKAMRELEMDDFHEMLLCGRKAAAWAWEHYEELASRPHAYTLYGPHAYFLGASIPSTSLTPVRARQLRPSTRRKDHLIYHLDEEYRVIRTITVLNHTYVDSTHHHFQLDGMTYAYPFNGTEKAMATDRVKALKFEDGKPVFYGMLSRRFVFAQFYEYLDADKMITTTYRYAPEAKRNVYGYPIDPAAPIGAMNSSVEKHVREEPVAYIDFSHWFV